MSRNPAAQGRKDSNHKAIADALRAIGCPVMDLSHAGNGVEDLLVGVRRSIGRPLAPHDFVERFEHLWIVVECKVPPVRFTTAQIEWRHATRSYPRLTVTSAQQAVDEIRKMTK